MTKISNYYENEHIYFIKEHIYVEELKLPVNFGTVELHHIISMFSLESVAWRADTGGWCETWEQSIFVWRFELSVLGKSENEIT